MMAAEIKGAPPAAITIWKQPKLTAAVTGGVISGLETQWLNRFDHVRKKDVNLLILWK